MPKGYLVSHISVLDPEGYEAYVAAAGEAIRKHGGKLLAGGGRFEILEGEGRTRNVIVEFASFEQARTWHDSPEYQAALKHRLGMAVADTILVEGA